MKNLKQLLACAAAIGLASCIAACSNGGTEKGLANLPSSNEKKSTAVLRFFSNVPDRTSGQGLLEERILNDYMEQNQTVTIQQEQLQDDAYKIKMQTYQQSDNMPDLWMQFGSSALLTPVVEGKLAQALDPADYQDFGFVNGALDSFTVEGKLYGLPKNSDFWVLYYNQKLLQENGLNVPKTTEDLLQAAEILNAKGIIPVALDGKDKYPIVAMIQNMVLRSTGDPAVLRRAIKTGDQLEDPRIQAGIAEYLKLVEGDVFQSTYISDDYGTAKNLFIQGEAAMFAMGSWDMGMGSDENIPEQVRGNIRAAKIPVVKEFVGSADDLVMWYGGGYAVSSTSEDKETALDLLHYMLSPEVYVKSCWQQNITIPPMNYEQYLTGAETPVQQDLTNIMGAAVSTTGDLFPDLLTPSFKNDSEDLTIELSRGEISSAEFLKQLSELVQREKKRNE